MRNLVKLTTIVAAALSLATTGATNARAGGWPVAAGVVGGFAAGAIVGRALVGCPSPVYYAYPRVYVGPICAPARVIVPVAPVCFAPIPVIHSFHYPEARVGIYAERPGYFRRR